MIIQYLTSNKSRPEVGYVKHNAIDITGQRFGRLVVLRPGPPRRYKGYTRGTWVCRCDCGVEHTTTGIALRRGGSTSCGCAQRETARASLTTHGEAGIGSHRGTVRYELWRTAKERARQRSIPFDLNLADIVVPEHCPALGLRLEVSTTRKANDNSPSLDRIDPSKGYVRGNVLVISTKANRIKNNATAEEVRKVADFLEKLT